MDLTWALVFCLCLISLILGMVLQAIILHPFRKEIKRGRQQEMRAHQRDATRRDLRRRLDNLDR